MEAAESSGKVALCGLKRMFFQMTTKAKQAHRCAGVRRAHGGHDPAGRGHSHRGAARGVLVRHARDRPTGAFLDHFCHPASMLLYFFDMPQRMIYHRARVGSGIVTFEYDDGQVASMCLHAGRLGRGRRRRAAHDRRHEVPHRGDRELPGLLLPGPGRRMTRQASRGATGRSRASSPAPSVRRRPSGSRSSSSASSTARASSCWATTTRCWSSPGRPGEAPAPTRHAAAMLADARTCSRSSARAPAG